MSLDVAGAVATLRGLTAKFDNAVMQQTPFYPSVCTIAPSVGADEAYGMLGGMPGMREWLGDRVFHSLRAGKFTIENKLWENSVAINKTDIEDDRLGMYVPLLEMLGQRAALHPDKLLVQAIEAAESSECFDGQYFFDTDHSWGESGSQSNDLTYDATDHTAVTVAEFKAAFRASVTALLGFKDDQGELLTQPTVERLSSLVVAVPLALRGTAHDAIESIVLGTSTNVVVDRPKIVCLPGLSSSAKFYTFNTDSPLRPFVFQARKPLSRQMKGMDDQESKLVKFMADARYNLGYLAWWNAVLTTFT